METYRDSYYGDNEDEVDTYDPWENDNDSGGGGSGSSGGAGK